ncbi:ATP synthase gamma chain [Buchnera aphidicola (Tetraneura ulmi)]|uniref:ATP synthase F1 subunit gamma n=1 Tax=Buchnera aphidicola TaxID=9 RepID=UPI003464374B
MSSSKEIRDKINAISNTQKITQAMEMVAVSKMRKIKIKMIDSFHYLENIKKVVNNIILEKKLGFKHSYLEKRKIKKVGIIVVSTNRGLCGSLNNNLFKKILLKIEELLKNEIDYELIIFGLKGWNFFSDYHNKIIFYSDDVSERFNLIKIKRFIKKFLNSYNSKLIDEIYISYNHFKNSMIYVPKIVKLLPIILKKNHNKKKIWSYLYEPNFNFLLDIILNKFLESKIYKSMLENVSSELSARMVAMRTATDNSKKSIQECRLIYNKLRQSAITQELTEIISGSSVIL